MRELKTSTVSLVACRLSLGAKADADAALLGERSP